MNRRYGFWYFIHICDCNTLVDLEIVFCYLDHFTNSDKIRLLLLLLLLLITTTTTNRLIGSDQSRKTRIGALGPVEEWRK